MANFAPQPILPPSFFPHANAAAETGGKREKSHYFSLLTLAHNFFPSWCTPQIKKAARRKNEDGKDFFFSGGKHVFATSIPLISLH